MINKTVYLLLLPLWFLIVVLYECFLVIMSNIKMLPEAIRLIIKRK